MDLTLEEKIKLEMKRRSYTYADLAERLGISVGYVFDIVRGNRNGGIYLEKILNILDIEAESFPESEF